MLRVTRILDANGLLDLKFVTTFGLERGQDVHEATAFDDRGTLDEDSVDWRVAKLLESWRKWRAWAGLTRADFLKIEDEVEHVPLQYRGRLDRVVLWRGRETVIDLKGGGPQVWHPIQTAGYALAYAAKYVRPTPARGAVYLQGDGSIARWERHDDRADFDTWRSLVVVAHFKEKNGLNNEPRPA